MKYPALCAITLFVLATSSFLVQKSGAQDMNYDQEWAAVDSLDENGLPQSAREKVLEIYSESVRQQQFDHTIKSLLFISRYTTQLEEDEANAVFNLLTENISVVEPPARGLLHAVIGDLYWQYYQARRYLLFDRPPTAAAELPDDVREWDARQLIQQAIYHFHVALSEPDLLQKTAVQDYAAVLLDNTAAWQLRPTLYDLVAHWAIDLFSNSLSGLPTPQDQFRTDDPDLFSTTNEFVDLALTTTDTTSFQYQTLLLFQDLLRFRNADDNPTALIDADLKRLKYVHQQTSLAPKDELYIDALDRLAARFDGDAAAAPVHLARAVHFESLAQRYRPELHTTELKHSRRQSFNICTMVITTWPDTRSANECRSLQTSQTHPELTIEAPSVVVPDERFLAKLQFRNLESVDIRMLPVDREFVDRLQSARTDERRRIIDNAFNSQDAIRHPVDLPDDGDMNRHSTEVSLPQLPSGMFLIIASAIDSEKQIDPGYTTVQVSRIGFVSRPFDDSRHEIIVSDRQTGEALPNATIALWERKFNQTRRDYDYRRIAVHEVDEQGQFLVPVPENQQRILSVVHDGSELFTDETLYARNITRDTTARSVSRFFTDRSIYRPGQTVYFKGLLMTVRDDNHKIAVNRETTVRFMDVNGQEIGSVSLTSNEFGTVQGSFVIPSSMLPGTVSIADGHGGTRFSIEEYKRPRFEVVIDELSGSPVLGDSITVSGSANSFFATAIGNAKVQFRVTRAPVFRPWQHYRTFDRSIWPPSSPTEIASGTTSTDGEGGFAIQFNAIPDPAINPDFDPSFSFNVAVTVVDITGEAISSTRSFRLNYSGIIAEIQSPESVDLARPDSLIASATSTNGVPLNVDARVELVRLEPPATPTRDRLWSQVDTMILSNDYIQEHHPLDRDVRQPHEWDEADVVSSLSLTVTGKATIPESMLSGLAPGVYRIKLAVEDATGRTSTSDRILTLYDSREDRLPNPELFWFQSSQSSATVGDEALFVFGSAFRVRVLFETEIDGTIDRRDWIEVDAGQQTVRVPVDSLHQGGFAARVLVVHSNRVFVESAFVDVPYEGRELDVSIATHRSMLEPGAEEEWRITIKGPDGLPAAAELAATMYDASLDQINPHSWALDLERHNRVVYHWRTGPQWTATSSAIRFTGAGYFGRQISYPRFNWFGFHLGNRIHLQRMRGPEAMMDMVPGQARLEEVVVANDAHDGGPAVEEPTEPVTIRRNLSELAFFYPQVNTDRDGNAVLSFTMPEALTRWRMMSLAHTKDLKTGWLENEVVTQKKLMITANPPRFLRRGDTVTLTAKVANLSADRQSGRARLELIDPETNEPLGEAFGLREPTGSFEIEAGASTSVGWTLRIPDDHDFVVYRVIATTDNYSDGEESILPILDNRILITETLPLWINGRGEKSFSIDRMSDVSASAETHRVILEYASNPVWYAVQSLPYLQDYPYEGSEQIFSRLYANAVSRLLLETNPGMEQVISRWKESEPEALLSPLQKNESLKSVVIEETPWLADAETEAERQARLVELFDEEQIREGLAGAVHKLGQLQLDSGAWPWFAGMSPNRFITQHIVKGFGWMRSIGALKIDGSEQRFSPMVRDALAYMDHQIRLDYERLVDRSAKLDEKHVASIHIHYLYTRTFFEDYPISDASRTAYEYYLNQAAQFWTDLGVYEKSMTASVMLRSNRRDTADQIAKSIKEFALQSEELGTYWKTQAGLYWHEAPIEMQAQLIASFSELDAGQDWIGAMQRWLLRQKQTHSWESTRATTDAVYALLRSDLKLLNTEGHVSIAVGDTTLVAGTSEAEAGTGYVQQTWNAGEQPDDVEHIAVASQNDNPSWGAIYWQYFEDQDAVSEAGGPLTVTRETFVSRTTTAGPELVAVDDAGTLIPGTLLHVRLTVKVDRDMEFVHLKDLRPAGTEPVSTLSGYRYSSGIGMYEAVSDASTSFFIDWLPKGTWIIDYQIMTNLAGDYGTGPATVQSLYAPEFAGHSKGGRIRIEQR